MLRGSHAHELAIQQCTWLPLNMFCEVHFSTNQQLTKPVLYFYPNPWEHQRKLLGNN